MKEHYLLDPDVIFLNHGSFGATPRPVFEDYQAWQMKLEHQPVQFITREMLPALKAARQTLGDYLNADADDLVYIPNATFGVNLIARSLQLKPGDEILTTDHEYGACENAWELVCRKNRAVIVKQSMPLPCAAPAEIVERLWQGVTARTKVIFISQITSPTALSMPVKLICEKARQAGLLTVIDGAHAPGQISLDLSTINPDFYVGNCHKWMLSPKGAGFLYARRELQNQLEPLVVSWGWGENAAYTTGSKYIDALEWWGTKDPSAYLAVPSAIRFQAEHEWPAVRSRCQQMLRAGLHAIQQLTGLPSLYPPAAQSYTQMAAALLPPLRDLAEFQAQLYQDYKIEIPCIGWKKRQLLRISVQGYNTPEDLDALVSALHALLPQHRI